MWKGIRISKQGRLCVEDICNKIIKISIDDERLNIINDYKHYINDELYVEEIAAIILICYVGNKLAIEFCKKYIGNIPDIIDNKYNMVVQSSYKYDNNQFIFIEINTVKWFKAKCIATYLNYGDGKGSIARHVSMINKVNFTELKTIINNANSIFILEECEDPKTVFINEDGLKEFLVKADKPKSIQFAVDLGINVKQKFTRKETDIVKELNLFCKTAKIKYKHQYPVKFGDNKYIIDYYLPEYNIVIEIDEFDHSDRDPEYEKVREKSIKKKLNCRFIRCNPDDPDFSIIELIGRIGKYIKN